MFSSNTSSSSFSSAQTEVIFTVSGSWVVPAGVTSVSALCVGAGGGGSESTSGGSGGGGGDLRYYNNLSVTPGETLTITTGLGGTPGATGTAGAFSRIARGATVLLEAAGGGGGTISGSGTKNGTSTTIAGSVGGGDGGTSGNPAATTCGGGGGAGGYSGAGGNGAVGNVNGGNGAGGGGGGGGGGGDGDSAGVGSGVSAFGLGSNGIGGNGSTINGSSATGGSYGDGGVNDGAISSDGPDTIGSYGGGGGGADNTTDAGAGGNGFVRIIWPGTSRSFPSTNVWMSEIVTGVIETQSSTSGTITIPLAALPGDLAVLSNMSATVGVQSDPAGWTRIVNQEAASPVMTVWYRILQAGDAGTTVTMTGGTSPSSEMILLRKASGVVSSVTVGGSTITQSSALIADQTQTVSGVGVQTSVVFGVFASSASAIASSDMTFTGGLAGGSNSEPSAVFTGDNGDNTRQSFMRFRIYDAAPTDPVIVKNNRDTGTQTMASFILGVN